MSEFGLFYHDRRGRRQEGDLHTAGGPHVRTVFVQMGEECRKQQNRVVRDRRFE
jgi:hypothetical protein